MELKHLVTFLAVARELSFTRAARDLDYVQSSVTAHIQALEADLGVPLFERLGRRVALTDAGRELRPRAQHLVGYAEQTREAVAGAAADPREIRGTLRIAAPESLCAYRLPAVLSALKERFPLLRVVFGPAGRSALVAGLEDGTLDAGFLLEESVDHPMTVAERMAREPLRLVAHPHHPLAARERVATAELAGETLLVIERGCAQRDVIDRELRRTGARPPTMEFVSVEALKRCAAAGLGVALVPEATIADEAGRGELAVLPWTVAPVLGVHYVLHRDRRPTLVLRTLAGLARTAWRPPAPAPATAPAPADAVPGGGPA
ncbi:LysR family transcriptional regulator [Streptomyces sp. TRM 70351]|uniref:LysR family transcriptional regulator n=1 Tax=Streptomyces sp. TRM 70351 TaxID=3116552 RepID=UPI002E7C0364|nr:LysR family transcriptional regulator [Streptomyces sp. TRM 70351]MEE1930442.1 LysR family transcriptional regulator [Streptomyces sp. TRM 70351]